MTPVAPGHAGSVTVKIDNPNHHGVVLTRVSGSVTAVTTGRQAGLPLCDRSWIRIQTSTALQPIPGKGSALVTLPVTFDNKSDVNQDNCKGVTYQFSFTAEGRQA